nr:2170_t:CDS:2 [Entrophospora candida]
MSSSTLINCICGAKIQLDRPYDERLFERHLKNNFGCKRNTRRSVLLTKKNKEPEIRQHPCLRWVNEEIKKYIGRKIVGVIAKESLLDEYQEEINKKESNKSFIKYRKKHVTFIRRNAERSQIGIYANEIPIIDVNKNGDLNKNQ